MKPLVMSDEYPWFCEALQVRGYKIIPTKKIACFLPPEQRHADMQLLVVDNTCFTLDDCRDRISGSYPENVRLNCLYFRGTLYGKLSAADASVLDFCRKNNIQTVNVKQGYTRCSVLLIGNRAAVTADRGIADALQKDGAEVLLIAPGHVTLPGFDCGFIGGAGFCDGDTVYCFGDITRHPDFEKIKALCAKHNSKIEILCADKPLTDLGGAVLLRSWFNTNLRESMSLSWTRGLI